MMPLRSHIAYRPHYFVSDLLLDVEVVIFHVWRPDIAIESEDVTLVIASSFISVHRHTWGDGPRHARRINGCCTGERVVGRSGIKVRRVRQVAQDHVLGKG